MVEALAQFLDAGLGPVHDVAAEVKFSPSLRTQHGTRVAAFDDGDGLGEFVDHLVVDAVLRRAVEDDRGDLRRWL